MSRWWRDLLQARLAPDAVTVDRRGPAPRRRLVASRAATPESAAGAHDWKPALASLAALLEATGWRKADLAVTLSNHYVRYAVLDWPASIRSDEEFVLYARRHLRDTFGEAADAWAVSTGTAWPGERRVVAAIDRDLMAAMHETASRAGLRLASVEPALAGVVREQQRRLPATAFRLASVESGRVCVLEAGERGWATIRNERSDADPARTLGAIIRQEEIRAGDGGTALPLFVHGPLAERIAADLDARWSPVALLPAPPAEHAR